LADLSSGCRFAPRSPYAHEQEWLDVRAPLVEIEDNHWVEDCPACRRLNSEALS
jgi:ABC-type dipeptide/oligopeptide/nickel transport system ATPase component